MRKCGCGMSGVVVGMWGGVAVEKGCNCVFKG